MAPSGKEKNSNTLPDFVLWLIVSIVIPLLPFLAVWAYIDSFSSSISVSIPNVLGRPDLVFISSTVTTTTMMDLLDTVETFKNSRWFKVIFAILILGVMWSILVYGVSLYHEVINKIDRYRVIDLLINSTIIVVGYSIFVQIFFVAPVEKT